jgi:hypothetical protein
MEVPYNTEEPRVETQHHRDIQRITKRLRNAESRNVRLLAGTSERPDAHHFSLPNSLKTVLKIILFPVLAYCGFKILLLLIIAVDNIF